MISNVSTRPTRLNTLSLMAREDQRMPNLEVLLSSTKNAYEITNERLKNIKGGLL